MPSKKSSKKSVKKPDETLIIDEEDDLFEDDDEELDEDDEVVSAAEEKADEILGLPAIITSPSQPITEQYPTESHLKNKVKYREGDVAPKFNEFLIIRKP
jgi:hypothetical protein